MSSDQCVLYTAADARMHDDDVVVPRDCVATQSDERHSQAVQHFGQTLKIATTPSTELVLAAARG